MSNKGRKKTSEKLMAKADQFIKEFGLSGEDGFERYGDRWWVIFQAVCVEAGIVEVLR